MITVPGWKRILSRARRGEGRIIISSYGTRSPPKNIRARGRIIFLFFPRAARAR